MKTVVYFLISVLAISVLIPHLAQAEDSVVGIVKSFEVRSGKLLLHIPPAREATFTIPQTAQVYMKVKGKDMAPSNPWQFLQDNLIEGTKVELLRSGGIVVTIWILEVSR